MIFNINSPRGHTGSLLVITTRVLVSLMKQQQLELFCSFQLPGGYIAKPFRTNHRVPSQGYLLYKQSKQLKAEFVGMPSSEINALHKKGVAVHDVLLTPEVAYTGEWAGRVRVVLHVQCMHRRGHSISSVT